MDDMQKVIQKIKQTNYMIFGFFVFLLLSLLIAGLLYQNSRRFTTEKWMDSPETRTRIVGDLLEQYNLVGMRQDEILSLLGMHNNDSGYFQQSNRFVYCLGPERSLISIDSEWLILDFSDGIVSDYHMTTD